MFWLLPRPFTLMVWTIWDVWYDLPFLLRWNGFHYLDTHNADIFCNIFRSIWLFIDNFYLYSPKRSMMFCPLLWFSQRSTCNAFGYFVWSPWKQAYSFTQFWSLFPLVSWCQTMHVKATFYDLTKTYLTRPISEFPTGDIVDMEIPLLLTPFTWPFFITYVTN